MKQIRKRLTYANVMSSIAVFLVIGGGAAFAATQLPKNSVGPKQLKKSAVKTSKISNQAVKAGKLATNAVTTNRIRDAAVTGPKIAAGAVTGDKIAAGAVGRGNLAEAALLPRAYAYVEFSGEVTNSIGIPNATNPVTGTYCFDLAFTPSHAQATGEADGEGNDLASVAIAGIGGGLTNCPAGTDVEVEMWDTGSNSETSEEFYLVVW